MSTPDETGRYVRVLTQGKALLDIEGGILRAASDGARVLMSTAGLSGLDAGSDSRNAAIAEWAEELARKHGLDWQRVGRDVLFVAAR